MFGYMTTQAPKAQMAKLKVGMVLAFRPGPEAELAGIPANVVHIWPRFPSGDYLVTLEFAYPIKVRNVFVRQMDAFVSELYRPQPARTATVH